MLFHAEENEVLQRDANEDINIHKEVVDEIQSIMLRIHDIKKSNLSVEKVIWGHNWRWIYIKIINFLLITNNYS